VPYFKTNKNKKMKIKNEMNLENFNAWSGAVETKTIILDYGFQYEFNELIEELYPDGIDETTLNDLLWFDSEWIFENLGIECYED